ncbi:hypothetical protein NAP1_00865 [Erythrobacter sp. NAP1]|nr:hypothetical protein NAP1_00865 [Erythrobacter sp. NAP1]
MFVAIGLTIAATYFDIANFSNGSGVLLVAGLVYAFFVAKREAAVITYVLSEDQIIHDEDEEEGPPVPTGMDAPVRRPAMVSL